MAAHRLFVWNAYHNGDVLLSRPIVRHLLDRFDVDITWCCWKNHELLIRDLPIKLLVLPHADGTARDLSVLCPPGHVSIDLWIGHYPDTHDIQWHNCVTVFNRQVKEKGLPLELTCNVVPMFDLPQVNVSVRDRAIFVDNGAARSTQSWFEFDMQALAAAFPDLNFYCAADPRCHLPNVIDCSRVNLLVLASISNHCLAIVGKGTGAHTCTFTEINRFKPSALMQFRMPAGVGYWDYPGSRLVRLNTHAELVAFLRQAQVLPQAALVGGGSAGRQANATAVTPLAGPALAKVSHGTGDDLARLGLKAAPPATVQTAPAQAPEIHVLANTATGGQIISFGRPPAAENTTPADHLRTLLRAYQAKPDPGILEQLCRQRRELARQLADVPTDQIQNLCRSEIGQRHKLLAGSRLPLLPAPVEDLPFIKTLEARLTGGWAIGVYLAGLLFRPPRFWLSVKVGEVPLWLFLAYPSQVLAPAQTATAPETRTFVAKLFAEAGLDPARTIALFAGGEDAPRTYPGLGLALQQVCAAGPWQVVALGSGADAAINQRCLKDSGAKSADWSGRLTWPQMVEVLRVCRLALGVEHPLAHIACALDTPNVIIHGGGNFGISLPYSPSTSVVTLPLTCFLCSWECPFARPHCVKDIAPEVVEVATREALEKRSHLPRLYHQHPAFRPPGPGTEFAFSPDLLPMMLFECIIVGPPEAPVPNPPPPSLYGCQLRDVRVPRHPNPHTAPGPASGVRVVGGTLTG